MTKEQKAKEIIAKIRKGSYEDWVERIGEGLEEYASIKTKKLVNALRRIEQMSDPGSYERAVYEMKSLASEALASYTGPAEGEKDYSDSNKERIISEYKQLMNIIYSYAERHPHIRLGESMVQFTVDRAKKYDELLAGKEPEKKDPWISVEERLPEKGQIVLAYIPACPYTDFVECFELVTLIDKEGRRSGIYTYWFPLPKSPAAANQEGNEK